MIQERYRMISTMTYKLTRGTVENGIEDGVQRVVNRRSRTPEHFPEFHMEAFRAQPHLRPMELSETLGDSDVSYFEVRVRGGASVGIEVDGESSVLFESYAHIGWLSTSYGYHSDDGRFYWSDNNNAWGGEQNAEYGEPWETFHNRGDDCVIGCGFHHDTYEMFFTKNGKFQGMVDHSLVRARYRAAFALHKHGDRGEINFGSKPFLFDIEEYCYKMEDDDL
uniref:SPRY domain-containing protein n=1 Tax=Cyclophora tenuis TaxID=216820 RepID=A0A7S1D870_CYCTE